MDAQWFTMSGVEWLVGIDEAGRGSLAGPLAFGAFAIRPDALAVLEGIKDSKQLSEKAREQWHERLLLLTDTVAIYGEVSSEKIDEHRMGRVIASGSRAIAKRMLISLGVDTADALFMLDGTLAAPDSFRQVSVIDGDMQLPVIAAASIVAKVRRDRAMRTMHCSYPQYGFNRHKGYGTVSHRAAIAAHGATVVHRKSFTLLTKT